MNQETTKEEIINGYWKVGYHYNNGSVRLINIYNHCHIRLSKIDFMAVLKGSKTISKIAYLRRKKGFSKGYYFKHYNYKSSDKLIKKRYQLDMVMIEDPLSL